MKRDMGFYTIATVMLCAGIALLAWAGGHATGAVIGTNMQADLAAYVGVLLILGSLALFIVGDLEHRMRTPLLDTHTSSAMLKQWKRQGNTLFVLDTGAIIDLPQELLLELDNQSPIELDGRVIDELRRGKAYEKAGALHHRQFTPGEDFEIYRETARDMIENTQKCKDARAFLEAYTQNHTAWKLYTLPHEVEAAIGRLTVPGDNPLRGSIGTLGGRILAGAQKRGIIAQNNTSRYLASIKKMIDESWQASDADVDVLAHAIYKVETTKNNVKLLGNDLHLKEGTDQFVREFPQYAGHIEYVKVAA